MERIEVRYTANSRNNSKVRGSRWLDPAAGKVYPNPTAIHTSIDDTLHPVPGSPGLWRSTDNEVQSVAQTTSDQPPASVYPDGNPKSAQGAKKFDLMHLPLPARIAVNQALEDGAVKYGKANWRVSGVSATVYLNAAARHIDQYNEGQEFASDSGVHNLGHAMACLAIVIDAAANGKLIDDRPVACVDTDALLLRPVKP